MHVVRGPWEVAERHGAGHLSRCTARAAHGRPGPARRQARQVATHHPFGLSRTNARLTWSGATSRRLLPTGCGSPTFPRKREVPLLWAYLLGGGCTSPSLPTFCGGSWVRRPLAGQCAPTWFWRWPFGSENTRELISGSSASLATVGCSTSLVRYGQALVDCGAVASVGSKGKSFRLCSGRARSSSLVQGRAHLLARAPAH